jgi:hypothetical protein
MRDTTNAEANQLERKLAGFFFVYNYNQKLRLLTQ